MDRHFKRLRPLPGEDGSGCHWIGEAIAGGASLLGGLLGSDAAEDAAERQAEAAARQLEFAKEVYQQQRADTAPYRAAGTESVGRLQHILGLGEPQEGVEGYGEFFQPFGEEQFRADPGYQFRLAEGEKAINRAAAARGQYMNPATVKELQRYGGGLADQTYQGAFNRYQTDQGNRFNRLAALAGIGQTGVSQTLNAANQYAGLGTGAIGAQGDALASGILNAANARISGLTGAASTGLDQMNISRMINLYGGGGANRAMRYPGTTYPGSRY